MRLTHHIQTTQAAVEGLTGAEGVKESARPRLSRVRLSWRYYDVGKSVWGLMDLDLLDNLHLHLNLTGYGGMTILRRAP